MLRCRRRCVCRWPVSRVSTGQSALASLPLSHRGMGSSGESYGRGSAGVAEVLPVYGRRVDEGRGGD